MISFKQELNKNQKLIILGIGAFLLLFVDFTLLISPMMNSIKKTSPKLAEAKKKYITARDAVRNIPRYKNQLKDFDEKFSSHKMRFSTTREISSLLQELSDTARNAGVKIVSVKPHTLQKEAAENAYSRFPISITATCGFHQLGVFLNKLENADTFMRVADISIKSDPENINSHYVYILVNTYILSAEA